MGDDDKLAGVAEFAQDLHETQNVGLIEGCINLVEETEGRGLYHVGCKKQANGRHGLLATGKQSDILQLLSRRLGVDLDARLEDMVGVREAELRTSATKEAAEHVVEVLLDLVVGGNEEVR